MPTPNENTASYMTKLLIESGGLEEIKTLPSFFLSLFRPEFVRNPKWRWWKPWIKKMIENPIPAPCEWSNETKIDIVRGTK